MRILGKMHSLTLTFMSLLGELRLEQRRLDAAVGFLVPALESQRKVLGRRCPIHVAVLNTLSRLGKYAVLCAVWHAVELLPQTARSDETQPNLPLIFAGRTWTAVGGTEPSKQAVEVLQECVAGRLELFGPDHPKVKAAQTGPCICTERLTRPPACALTCSLS